MSGLSAAAVVAGEGDQRFSDLGGDGVGESQLRASQPDLTRQASGDLGSGEALVIRWLVHRSLTSNRAN